MKNNIILTRMLLRNWTSVDEIIDFSETTTLFHGANGSGKSTAVDALNLVLSGSKKFNDSNDKVSRGRNINSAIHNVNFKTESVGRPGVVIGYIILEFYDYDEKCYFLHGLQMFSKNYVPGVGNVDERYFRCKDKRLEDLLSVVWNKDENINNMDLYKHKDEYSGLQFYDNKDRAFVAFFQNRRMKETKRDKYESQNRRTLKAKLTDSNGKKLTPNSFVKEYVLNESDHAAENSMKNTKAQKEAFQSMNRDLEREEEKKTVLENILKTLDRVFQLEKEAHLLDGSEIYCLKTSKEEELTKLEAEHLKLEHTKESLVSEINELTDRKEEYNNEKDHLNNELSKNSSADTDLLAEAEAKIKKYEKDKSYLNDFQRGISILFDVLGMEKALIGTTEDFLTVKGKIDEKINAIRDNVSELAAKIKAADEEKSSLDAEISELRKGSIITNNASASQLKNAMNDYYSKNGIDEEAHLLYEMVEHIDPEWQTAIESFLGKRRYALLVPDKYMNEALKIYKAYPGSMIARIHSDAKMMEKSAASAVTIKSADELASKYLYSLLGRVILCDTEDELKHAAVGLMKDGRSSNATLFENRSAGKITLLCGKEAIKYELEQKTNRRKEVFDKLEKLKKTCKIDEENAKKARTYYDSTNAHLESVNFNAYEDYDEAVNTHREISKRIAEAEETAAYQILLNKVEDIRAKIKVVEKDLAEKHMSLGNVNGQMNENESKTKAVTDEIAEQTKLYVPYAAEETEIIDYVKAKGLTVTGTPKARINLNKRSVDANAAADEAQKKYMEFDKTFTAGKDQPTYDRVKERYDTLKDVEISEMREKLTELESKLTESKDNFFRSLYSDYENAENELRKLNAKLREIPFCGDRIQIKIKPSSNADIRRNFEAIKRCYADETDFMKDGCPIEATESDREDVNDLFMKILENKDGKAAEYENYKTYIEPDVQLIRRVKTEDGEKETSRSLEVDNKSNSGGQEQTPYYIILAISLLSSFKDDGVKVILLDEAFSKMDAGRVEKVLQFFKENNMQVILSTMRDDLCSMVDITHIFNRNETTGKTVVISTRYDSEKGESVIYGKEDDKKKDSDKVTR